jgi:hypothetical protein
MVNSLFRFLGQSFLFLCCMTTAQATPPERIVFPYGNAADRLGFFSVLAAFRAACLAQPVTRDLPARLVPEGYQVVSRAVHWWGTEEPLLPKAAILSKTGREDSDIAGGYPIIDFMLPTAENPDGSCEVRWKRRWDQDYPDGDPDGVLRLDMAASLPARVSWYLNATLIDGSVAGFYKADSYFLFNLWRTECTKATLCRFEVIANFDEDGIDVRLTPDDEVRK